MHSSSKHTENIEPLPLKDLEENLQELLARCRKLRQLELEKSDN